MSYQQVKTLMTRRFKGVMHNFARFCTISARFCTAVQDFALLVQDFALAPLARLLFMRVSDA